VCSHTRELCSEENTWRDVCGAPRAISSYGRALDAADFVYKYI